VRRFLGDAAIAHLAVAELDFHDAEDVFDLRAHAAEATIAGGQPPSRRRTSLRKVRLNAPDRKTALLTRHPGLCEPRVVKLDGSHGET